MDENKAIATRVAETMNHHGCTINKLSKESGVPYATLHRKLNGKSDFTVRELGDIARVLSVTIADLIPYEILEAA